MALINQIRNNSGIIIGVMAIAMVSMLVLFSVENPSSLTGSNNIVGTIGGKEISITEYQQRVEMLVIDYTKRSGTSPDENTMVSIRDQVWRKLIEEIVYQEQFDELGVTVTQEELEDMILGVNIHPGLYQAPVFQNQTTGQFDVSLVQQYLANFDQLPEENQQEWYKFEQGIREERLQSKYTSLFALSAYITNSEAKKKEGYKNEKSNVNLLYVPYSALPDSGISVDDAGLKNYYNENKNKYKVEANKAIEYVEFKVVPSEDDSMELKKEIARLYEIFKTEKDDSLFIRNNSDAPMDTNFLAIGELPATVLALDDLDTGSITSPYIDNGAFKIHKIISIIEDTIFSARASHILFKGDENDKEKDKEALKKCKEILKEIKAGKSFAEMAQLHGSDGTASKGGDLGWFKEGNMVGEFNDAVFKATKLGLLSEPVKTNFGYHLIEITGLKTNKKYHVGTVQRDFYPSDKTNDDFYRMADNFAANSRTLVDFRNEAEKQKFSILSADNIKPSDNTVRNLTSGRQLVRWINGAEVNQVSEVLEAGDSYLIAAVTKATEKGFTPLAEVRFEIEAQVRNKIKGEKILSNLQGMTGSFEDIAANYNSKSTGATVKNAPDFSLSSGSLPGIGVDNIAAGKIAGTAVEKRSGPFAGKQGVYIIEVKSRTNSSNPNAPIDKKPYLTSMQNQIFGGIFDAIKDLTSVEDDRNNFY